MKDNSAEPWCPAVAGAGKLNVTRDVGVGVDGLTDRVWPDGLADVVVAELAVEDTEAEPGVVAGLEPPPHAARAPAASRPAPTIEKVLRFMFCSRLHLPNIALNAKVFTSSMRKRQPVSLRALMRAKGTFGDQLTRKSGRKKSPLFGGLKSNSF